MKTGSRSIRGKIVLLTLSIAIGSVSLYSVISLMVNYRITLDYNRRYSQDVLSQLSVSVNSYLTNIDFQVYSFIYNNLSQGHLRKMYTGTRDISVDTEQYINNLLYMLSNSLPDGDFHLFMEGNLDRPFHTPRTITPLVSPYNFKLDDWYGKITATDMNTMRIYVSTENQAYYATPMKDSVTTVYRIRNAQNLETMGYLLVDIPAGSIANLVAKNLTREFPLVISTNENVVLFDSTAGEAGADRIRGEPLSRYTVFEHDIAEIGWRITGYVPNTHYYEVFMPVLTGSLLCAVLICLFATFFSLRLSTTVTIPLKRLSSAMAEVEAGMFGNVIDAEADDEVGYLIGNFNNMTLRIEDLTKKNQSALLLQKDAQIAVLQSQINPHFLYNTLEMMKGVATGECAPVIRKCCNSLSKIFSYNLKAPDVVRLGRELEQVYAYISIMQLRFEGLFTVEYCIDETLLQYKCLKFTLQPLIENAILHGFSDILEGGVIKLAVTRGKSSINVCITDNGKGVPKAGLDLLCNNMRRDVAASEPILRESIGLRNTNIRLFNQFGKDYRFDIISGEGTGTSIELQFPQII